MKDRINEPRDDPNSVARPFYDQYLQLQRNLNEWRHEMTDRIQDMYLNALIELDTSYERLDAFRETLQALLDEERLTDTTIPLTTADIANMSSRLTRIEGEIDSISNSSFYINCQQEQIHLLPDSINNKLYSLITHSVSPEAVLATNTAQELSLIIQPILTQTKELRVLIHDSYVPFVVGQLGCHAKMLKDKYELNSLKVYPTCAPSSTERVLLLSGPNSNRIIECLMEIYQHLYRNPPANVVPKATILYSPEYYDASLVDDYGGFADKEVQRRIPRSIDNSGTVSNAVDEEAFSGYQDEEVEDFTNDLSNSSMKATEPLRVRRWTLSDAQAGALFGPQSSRLHQIRCESNAWIVIQEASGNSTRRPMSIRGTKAEIEHATKLILETIKHHDRKLPVKYNHRRGK